MYSLVLFLSVLVTSVHAESKKFVIEVSHDPVVRAELVLNEFGHLTVAQINEQGQSISKPQSVTTKSLRFWQRLNRDDTEQVQNVFVVEDRVFAVTYPYQEVAPRYGAHESRLHEFRFVYGRTWLGKFGIGAAFATSIFWSMPLLIVGERLLTGNSDVWAAAHGWLAQLGSIVYLGTLGATGWLCQRTLSDPRGVHSARRMTPVEVDQAPVHVAQIVGDVSGAIDDIIYKTKTGRTGSLRDWIRRMPP